MQTPPYYNIVYRRINLFEVFLFTAFIQSFVKPYVTWCCRSVLSVCSLFIRDSRSSIWCLSWLFCSVEVFSLCELEFRLCLRSSILLPSYDLQQHNVNYCLSAGFKANDFSKKYCYEYRWASYETSWKLLPSYEKRLYGCTMYGW